MDAEIYKNQAIVSNYQPTDDIRLFTKEVKDDYRIGTEILNKPYVELNERSIIEDENRGQLMFNAFVDTNVEDANEAWKWRGTRSMARNKGIAMHANLTANYLLPLFLAQNEEDDIDRDLSETMRDIIEWMAMPTNSNYQSSFLQMVFGMITNPVTYMGADFMEVMQTIKIKQENGSVTTKEILDEVLSGFQAPIWSSSQVLITNAYERNIQKQKCIIKRRFVDKSELQATYKDHPNWDYVQQGVRSIYNVDDELFYDVKDESHRYLLVAEETYLSRRGDTEVCFLNGIYMGEKDIEANPIKHRDNHDAPKYNVVPFGYHRIGEHFFYYKSMMNTLGWDNMLYDAMSEVVMNRALLEVEMPIMITGTDKIDSEVIFPNAVIPVENENAKATPLLPNSNMVGGFNALRETEKSMNDGSVNETIGGQNPTGGQTAYAISQAQTYAKKIISGVGKSLAESIIAYGDLMKDIAINHITIPEVGELLSGQMKLEYKNFLLPNKNSGTKTVDKSVQFDSSLIGVDMTEDEKDSQEMALLQKIGYPDNTKTIRLVNPELFANMKYLTYCDTEEMFAKNAEYWQPVLLNLKTALAMDPYTDQEALTRRLMHAYFQSGGDDFVKKAPMTPPTAPPNPDNAGGNTFGAMVQNKSLANASGSVLGG